jgi:putative addiction module component (TIGR02574 family)
LPASPEADRLPGMAHPKFDFSSLTPDERIQLAEDLWDSLGEQAGAVPLTDAQARELDRRLAAYRADGDPGEPWETVMERLEQRARERGG